MKQYIDYNWYITNTHGSCPQEDFERLAVKASRYISSATFNRAAAMNEDDLRMEAIKLTCCELVDEYYAAEHGGGIASETNDGIDVTYVNGISNTKSPEERLYRILFNGLAHTGLLYQGGGSLC